MAKKILLDSDNVKLYCGDCLEQLEYVPERSIQTVCIDPPYNIKKQPGIQLNRIMILCYLLLNVWKLKCEIMVVSSCFIIIWKLSLN